MLFILLGSILWSKYLSKQLVKGLNVLYFFGQCQIQAEYFRGKPKKIWGEEHLVPHFSSNNKILLRKFYYWTHTALKVRLY